MKKHLLKIAILLCSLETTYAQPQQIDSSSEINSSNIVTTSASEPASLASPASLPAINYHLTARPWHALNISRSEYLNTVEGIVREIVKFQNSNGSIIDPYANRETQYATPYFANAIGTLLSVGRATDLLDEGIAAMNSATAHVANGASSIPDDHGEFFIAPLSSAITLYAPHVSVAQMQIWEKRMATPLAEFISGRPHNWRTYAMKGEWNRAKNGYVDKEAAIGFIENSWNESQKERFTNNSWNFYHDKTGDPDSWPYESVARSNLLALIADGYNGTSKNDILKIVKRGTQSSLLLQDPSGQTAAGGRSGDHTWNDILSANGYETMAEIALKEGDVRLAGQYRHAAVLAFKSVQRWKRFNGTYSVTKNHFSPGSRTRYASYSFFSSYNGNMIYHISENYLRHKSNIAERPAPNEIGGYTIVSDRKLATAVANAGGMHMEVCLRGSTEVRHQLYWTTLGVVRFARPMWDSRLGPSDGVRETKSRYGVSFAPTFLENGEWVRLASVPDRYEAFFTTQFTHPLLVRCRVIYKPKTGKTGPTFTNNFILTPDGILSTLTSTTSPANFGITWPLLTFDGATNLTTILTPHTARTSFANGTDQQNFIALHSSPKITASDHPRRSSYGDLSPVRMVSGTASNVTFIYPRNAADPGAESVRQSFSRSGNSFSTTLGRVEGNTYVGRTSAGGVAKKIDINNDGTPEATFNITTGFVMQLENGKITKIETDKDVTAVIGEQVFKLKAYTPTNVPRSTKVSIAKVIASADDGNVALNTLDRNYKTRWAARGNGQWIKYLFNTTAIIKSIKIAWYKGDERKASFEIQSSLNNNDWTTVFTGKSTGNSTAFETYSFQPVSGRYVRIVCYGNDLDSWNAITEVEILNDVPQVKINANLILNNVAAQLEQAQQFANKSLYPRSTNSDGTVKRVRANNWTSGFFPGSLWMMYENTKDEIWRTRAEQWTAGLEGQKYNTSTHDVGFILHSSFGQGYRLTGNEKYKAILLQGAKSLATRFNPTVGCIKSWDNNDFSFPVIIDNMMNLEILFWATKVTGDSSYYKIAVKHALKTMANHFRRDNSSYHVVDYNPKNGSVIRKVTRQGLSDSSDWARGQAWGLYGFTMCYRETRDIRFLDMAKKIANFYTTHLNMPSDLIPYWDFDATRYRDVSAASIASSALLELSEFAGNKRTAYYNYGINILKSLCSPKYFASVGSNNNFILKHGVGSKPQNVEVDKPLCYADYYFIEALLRYKKPAPVLKAVGANNQIALKWNISTGARFYSIKRSLIKGGPYSVIASKITNTRYTDSRLQAGKRYYYIVIPSGAAGDGVASREASATTNKAPIVNLINTGNNQQFSEQNSVHVIAAANDLDGTISKVEFYLGSTLVKTENSYPYSCLLTNLPPGSYTVTARAIDDQHLSTTSAPVTITVTASKSIAGRSSAAATISQPNLNCAISLRLSPNPTTNALNIFVNETNNNIPLTISIMSASGNLIKRQKYNSKDRISLNVSKLTTGVYTIRVQRGNMFESKQFVKL